MGPSFSEVEHGLRKVFASDPTRLRSALENLKGIKDYTARKDSESSEKRVPRPSVYDTFIKELPQDSNFLVIGPPFIGKETLVYDCVVRKLKIGVPAVVVTTDTTPQEILGEMAYLYPGIMSRAGRTLMFVDAYSKSMRLEVPDYAIGVDDINVRKIAAAVENASKKFERAHTLAMNLSDVLPDGHTKSDYLFFKEFIKEQRKGGATSFYQMCREVHKNPDAYVDRMSFLADREMELTTDGINTHLRVSGSNKAPPTNVRYTHSKSGLYLIK